MEEAVRTESLTKVFGTKRAVDGLSVSIPEGQFVGLLGPNGAGKTTTIKMLTGLLRPTEGSIYYYGRLFEPRDREVKALIGVVPQYSNLDRDLTAYENLNLHCILYGMPPRTRKQKIEEALEFSGLSEWSQKPVRVFSGGMRRRLVIVRALLHEPRILYLDEPTVGLDPQSRRSLWDLIVRINREKAITIVLTTHYIEEAERLCQRVLIINQGRIIADGEPHSLKAQL
ncbi:MAG: ATP-binding cassette domain-containing protein, partial [Nitrospirae bacterium]